MVRAVTQVAKKILSVHKEQCVNVNFLFTLGKSATETYLILQQVYGDECLSRTQVFVANLKARMSKSKFKAMMIVFFDIRGIVHVDWVPEGQTVNQQYYRSVLTTLREGVQKK